MAKFLNESGLSYFKSKLDALLETLLAKKVDKVEGKGLSTNDYTTAEKTKLAAFDTADKYAKVADVEADLATKVDKVSGKGLSTNDYTTAEKTKLAAFDTADKYAKVADVNTKIEEVNATLDTKVDKAEGKGLSTNDYTTAEKTKLAAFDTADKYAKKSDLTSLYKYSGSVATFNDLPSDLTSDLPVSPVYNVEDTGMNYAWTGTEWDALGNFFQIESITTDDIDALFAA